MIILVFCSLKGRTSYIVILIVIIINLQPFSWALTAF
jgi:hypothetical protein